MEPSIDSLVTVEGPKDESSEPVVTPVVSPRPDDEKLPLEYVDTNISLDRTPTSGPIPNSSPFKRWVNSLRPRKVFGPEPHVDGWQHITQSNEDQNYLSPRQGSLEQQWENRSGKSSHLGTIKTATMSVASHSVVRSRRNTQSTTNRSKSDFRNSIDSLRPVQSTSIDEEAQNRAIKRRQVLQEIIATESDYIFDLKALTNVCFIAF